MRRAALLAVLLTAALPGVAGAKLPHPRSTAIKPGVSIGGIKLDMSRSRVFALWGHTTCPGGDVCYWRARGNPSYAETATVSFVKNKVYLVGVSWGVTGSSERFKPGPLSRWKTARGIHLGSRKRDVHRAYPGAKANNSTGVEGFDLFHGARPDLTLTRFSTPGFGPSATRLRYITLNWDSCHYMTC